MRRNLEWCLELDAGCGRPCLLAYDTLTSKQDVAAIGALAQKYFTEVRHCEYSEPPVKGWPAACNWAWQSVARWMFESPLKQPWLWLEADAVPLKPGWVLTLEKAHTEGGKSFGGHVVKDMNHMNGVGIYPWDVMRRNEMAMLTRAAAWDVVLKPNVEHDCVRLNHLIQHAWNVHPVDRNMIWNGDGTPLSFREQADVDRYMDFNAVLLHRVKDGSLIPMLRERHRAEQEKQRLIESTEYNVPQHVASVPAVEFKREDWHGDKDWPNVHILIVTYWKDAPWLEYCLKALKKFCTGFTGITVAIPRKDFSHFAFMKADYGVTLRLYDETRGKGMIEHMARMAMADEFVPEGTDFVCHLDSDCIFHTPTTPADYFTDGKPVYLFRTWQSLTTEDPKNPGSKVVSDCAQWFTPTVKQLGFDPDVYTMCRHPSVFPLAFYKQYREHVASVQKMPFLDYMLSGRNEFPQDRMDWTAMGAWAYQMMHGCFHWVDIGAPGAVVPKDRQKTFWSHAGIKPETKAEMEGFLK